MTPEQCQHGRLAEGLREMIPFAADIHFPPIEMDGQEVPCIWPADNIRQILGDAADLIEELTMRGRR